MSSSHPAIEPSILAPVAVEPWILAPAEPWILAPGAVDSTLISTNFKVLNFNTV